MKISEILKEALIIGLGVFFMCFMIALMMAIYIGSYYVIPSSIFP